jgi:hypothetical protein
MKFNILDHTGHTTLDFTGMDTTLAMAKFNELVGLGSTAATRKTGEKDYTVTKSFDPTADETLFIPRMQGG